MEYSMYDNLARDRFASKLAKSGCGASLRSARLLAQGRLEALATRIEKIRPFSSILDPAMLHSLSLWVLLVPSCVCVFTFFPTFLLAQETRDFGVPLAPPDPLTELAITLKLTSDDAMPANGVPLTDDPAIFEKLVVHAKQAGYNTLYCAFRDYRLELCRKHGVKLMIDVLAGDAATRTDIRQPAQREKLRKICEKLQGDNAVWGYNLCHGPLDRFAPEGSDAINQCLALLRTWDSSHPVWVASSAYPPLDKIQGTAGVLACVANPADRDLESCDQTLAEGFALSQTRIDVLGRTFVSNGDGRRLRYAINTSLASGVKAIYWTDAGPLNAQTGELDASHPLLSLLREIGPLAHEIAEIDRPQAVYATSKALGDAPKMPGTETRHLSPIPVDCWAQVVSGEAIVGFFKYDSGYEALLVANRSAQRPQRMVFEVNASGDTAPSVELLNRKTGQWDKLTVNNNRFEFNVTPGGGELLRLLGVATD